MRLARFLLAMAFRHGAGNPTTVPMSRIDVADYLDMSVQSLSRELLDFADARLISIPNIRQVEIIDVTALEEIAEAGARS